MARAKSNGKSSDSAANLGFDAKLWLAADKLHNNMDAADYKHVMLIKMNLRGLGYGG